MSVYHPELRRSYTIIRLAKQWLRNKVIADGQFAKIQDAYSPRPVETSSIVSSAIHFVMFSVLAVVFGLLLVEFDFTNYNLLAAFAVVFAALCILCCDFVVVRTRTIYSGFDKALVSCAVLTLFLGVSLFVRPFVAPEPLIEVITTTTASDGTEIRTILRKQPTVQELSDVRQDDVKFARHFGLHLNYALIFLAIVVTAALRYRTLETGVLVLIAATWTMRDVLREILQIDPAVRPWIMFALFAVIAITSIMLRKSGRVDLSHNTLMFVEVSAIVGMYASVNIYVVDEIFDVLGGPDIESRKNLHWLITFAVPILLIGIAIIARDRVALRMGVACFVMAVFTFQQYFLSDYVKEFLVALGVVLLFLTRLLALFFAEARDGFTSKPAFTEDWDDSDAYELAVDVSEQTDRGGGVAQSTSSAHP